MNDVVIETHSILVSDLLDLFGVIDISNPRSQNGRITGDEESYFFLFFGFKHETFIGIRKRSEEIKRDEIIAVETQFSRENLELEDQF